MLPAWKTGERFPSLFLGLIRIGVMTSYIHLRIYAIFILLGELSKATSSSAASNEVAPNSAAFGDGGGFYTKTHLRHISPASRCTTSSTEEDTCTTLFCFNSHPYPVSNCHSKTTSGRADLLILSSF